MNDMLDVLLEFLKYLGVILLIVVGFAIFDRGLDLIDDIGDWISNVGKKKDKEG